jgi:AcrR family transcriptional regulator
MSPESLRAQQKQRTRAALLAAAREAFAARGFDAATIRDIARRAGVATGTVFVHFPDKQALLAEVLHETLQTALEAGWRTLPAAPLTDQLLHLADRLYRQYAAQPELARVLVKESLFMTGEPGRRLDVHRSAFFERVESLLRPGAKPGGPSPGELARVFFALYLSTLIAGLRGELGAGARWRGVLRRALQACGFEAAATGGVRA